MPLQPQHKINNPRIKVISYCIHAYNTPVNFYFELSDLPMNIFQRLIPLTLWSIGLSPFMTWFWDIQYKLIMYPHCHTMGCCALFPLNLCSSRSMHRIEKNMPNSHVMSCEFLRTGRQKEQVHNHNIQCKADATYPQPQYLLENRTKMYTTTICTRRQKEHVHNHSS